MTENQQIATQSPTGEECGEGEKSGLRFPAVHRDINELSRRIVNSHFSKATVPGLLRRIALSACDRRGFQSPFHIFHLKAKVVDPFAPATRRQDRHIDVSVGKIDCPLAIVSHWPSPGLGHAEGLLIKRRGFLLILHLNRDMFDLSHRLLLCYGLSKKSSPEATHNNLHDRSPFSFTARAVSCQMAERSKVVNLASPEG